VLQAHRGGDEADHGGQARHGDGLTSSTILSLFLVPVVFLFLAPRRARRADDTSSIEAAEVHA
jgi:multidrug efflux pump subunit AcrB